MGESVKDGTGTCIHAKVGDRHRLHTHALTTSTSSVASMRGDAFNVSSELVTLTSDSDSALLYVENNEDHSISVTTLFVNLGTSTDGSGKSLVSFHLNPNAGTIISDATPAQVLNRNVTNSETLDAATYKGAEGKTISGGDIVQLPLNGGPIVSEYVLPKGAKFALSVTPPTGNTSMVAQIGFLVIKNYDSYTIE